MFSTKYRIFFLNWREIETKIKNAGKIPTEMKNSGNISLKNHR